MTFATVSNISQCPGRFTEASIEWERKIQGPRSSEGFLIAFELCAGEAGGVGPAWNDEPNAHDESSVLCVLA
jgi:hypothetical protein